MRVAFNPATGRVTVLRAMEGKRQGDYTRLVNLTQLDILLQQVIRARARVDDVVRDSKIAAETLAGVQRQLEVAMVKEMTVDGDHAHTVTTL